MTKKYSYFAHKECEYFPCHKNADPENFNCLFCYCPLYVLGNRCGGSFTYCSNGNKDCSGCDFPHLRENYAAVVKRYGEIMKIVSEMDKEKKSDDQKEGQRR